MSNTDHLNAVEVDIATSGDVPPEVRDYARQKIGALVRYSTERILHARIRFTRNGNPALARPMVAQASLDVNGRPARAQVRRGNRGTRPPMPSLSCCGTGWLA